MNDEARIWAALAEMLVERRELIASFARAQYDDYGKGIVHIYWDAEAPPSEDTTEEVRVRYVPVEGFVSSLVAGVMISRDSVGELSDCWA